jgi:hypothetical protein
VQDAASQLHHDTNETHPWGEWGTTRHDCAPHRGNVLMLLATIAILLGLSSFCLVVTGWIAISAGWAVTWLAQRDLEQMTAGTMDPVGRRKAVSAAPLGLPPSLGFSSSPVSLRSLGDTCARPRAADRFASLTSALRRVCRSPRR